jgi:hypothetical protein
MEEISARQGVATCTLQSTKTAERFYTERGYAPAAGGSATLAEGGRCSRSVSTHGQTKGGCDATSRAARRSKTDD